LPCLSHAVSNSSFPTAAICSCLPVVDRWAPMLHLAPSSRWDLLTPAPCSGSPSRQPPPRFLELMDTDLHQVIKANYDMTKEHHQFFLYQMLLALKYIHTVMRIHGNLYFHLKGILSSLHFICALCSWAFLWCHKIIIWLLCCLCGKHDISTKSLCSNANIHVCTYDVASMYAFAHMW
jgi:hypothetical protein